MSASFDENFEDTAFDQSAFDNFEHKSFEHKEIKNLMLLFYLMPVFGVGPAMWTLSRPDRSPTERALSRMAIKLMLVWFAGTVTLDMGVENIEVLKLPLLIVSSLFTSGYFVLNLGLMLRLWRGKTIDLPLIGRVSRRWDDDT